MLQQLKSFEYFEPDTVQEVVQTLFKYSDKAKLIAGGIDLVPRIRKRELKPEYMISLQRIPELDYIKGNGTSLIFGALTSLRSLELSPLVQKDYMLLYEAVHQIASVQVKTTGTAVGNLCVATPASDVAVALLALSAKLKIVSPSGERTVPIENFFVGVNKTILEQDEIVTEVLLPSPQVGLGGVFMKLTRTAADVAKVNAAVVLVVNDNTIRDAKIALGSVAATVIRAKKAEKILTGRSPEPSVIVEAAEAAANETKPITDIRSTAEYRKEITKILVRRAIEKASERAKE